MRTDRYEIVRALGKGGMGAVFEVFDRTRGTHVALKTLVHVDPASIYRFKREFRALADVAHPNLLSLYELEFSDDEWFLTMEVIDGVDFISFVRPASLGPGTATPAATTPSPAPEDSPTETQPTGKPKGASPSEPGVEAGARPVRGALDLDRLRGALRQLTAGILALHDSGHLHRDIKPSNVLVTREQRVVLLDYGVIAQAADGRYASEAGERVGTPAYMAPEQGVIGGAVSEASDWYAVGVMVYEALTGHRPFPGPAASIIDAKLTTEPPPPRALWPEVPEELDVCVGLIRVTPTDRLTGDDVMRLIGRRRRTSPLGAAPGSRRSRNAWLGRAAELAALRRALAATPQGARAVFVHGSSGVGKSALTRQFLDEVGADPQAVILEGRCYPRESVPYKAVDSVVDSLCRFLIELPRHEANAVLPRDVRMLAQVFPVLRRVEAIDERRERVDAAPDAHELRRRAFAALRELLGRLAEQRPVVLFIDDLQWGDADSAPLLDAIIRPPDSPRLLLLGCYRTEDSERSPLLRALARRFERLGPAIQVEHLRLEPLSIEDSRTLAVQLLDASGRPAATAEAIARESGGNPYFVHELVQSAGAAREGGGGALSLDDVIRVRLERLPAPARKMLEVVAVAGQPITHWVAQHVAEVDARTCQKLLRQLGAAHLVRLTGSRDDDLLETYHDRIRETLVRSLPEDVRKGHHMRLAVVLRASDRADAETLAEHFRAGGDFESALHYAERAADQATAALAFDRAAGFLRQMLAMIPAGDRRTCELEIRLGDALASAGRGAAAAEAYLRAAELAGSAERLELQRRAAEQLLRSGHVQEGIDGMRAVLADVGMKLSATARAAAVLLAWRRVHLGLRGLRFRERDAGDIAESKLRRIDACWSVSVGLSMVDPIQGVSYHTKMALLSLREGELYRVVRSLAVESVFLSTQGFGKRRRVDGIIERALALAARCPEPHALGIVKTAHAMTSYLTGDLVKTRSLSHEAEAILREQCTNVVWEIDSMVQFRMWALYNLGEFGELFRSTPAYVDAALERGDRYAATSLQLGLANAAWLIPDHPQQALECVERGIRDWSTSGYHLQHYYELLARSHIDLYQGDAAAAWVRMTAGWTSLQKSLILRIQSVRVEALHLRGRCAVAAAVAAADPAPSLREAARMASRLAGERFPFAVPFAAMIRASVALQEARRDDAVTELQRAAERFEATSQAMYAAAARYRLGQLLGGEQGIALRRAAAEQMTGQQVVRVDRMVGMLAPGAYPASDS